MFVLSILRDTWIDGVGKKQSLTKLNQVEHIVNTGL